MILVRGWEDIVRTILRILIVMGILGSTGIAVYAAANASVMAHLHYPILVD